MLRAVRALHFYARMPKRQVSLCTGFSLVETLIATLIVASAVGGLAHLVALGARQAGTTRQQLAALATAQSKLEELRSVPWTYASDGTPISSASLTPSPPDALLADRDGYVEHVDRFGVVVAPTDVLSSHFTRRWSVTPLYRSDPNTLVLRVCVYGNRSNATTTAMAQACVVSIRERRP
jgi:type II secretory pathway pseudopilin PulG